MLNIIRKCKSKITMRYYFTSTRMAIIKKTDNDKYYGGCGEIVTLIHSWWAIKWSSWLKTSLEDRITIWPSNSAPRYILKRSNNRCAHKNLYMNHRSNTIHNNQRVGATQINKSGAFTQECVFSHRKEWGTDICYHTDEPWKYSAEWNKPVPKYHVLYDSVYMKCLE